MTLRRCRRYLRLDPQHVGDWIAAHLRLDDGPHELFDGVGRNARCKFFERLAARSPEVQTAHHQRELLDDRVVRRARLLDDLANGRGKVESRPHSERQRESMAYGSRRLISLKRSVLALDIASDGATAPKSAVPIVRTWPIPV